jgi:hypothetical protein
MPDEEILSVEHQPAQEVAQSTESDETHNVRQEETQQAEQRKRNDVEYNWNEARRKMQDLERRAQEQDMLIARLSSKDAPVEDDLEKLSDDDIITVAQHKKMTAKIAKQVAEEVHRQREASTMEERILAKYPDYEQVVTPENIELLKKTEPELALSLHSLEKDPYSQAIAAYKLMKKTAPAPSKVVPIERKKALENSQKPVSVQAVSKQSGLNYASAFEGGLTPELRKQIYAEMQQAIKAG